jgi:hypothetical protein
VKIEYFRVQITVHRMSPKKSNVQPNNTCPNDVDQMILDQMIPQPNNIRLNDI